MQLNLNHDRLEMIGRIEAVRRQLGEATDHILKGADAQSIKHELASVAVDLSNAHFALGHMENFNV